jgi:radical SAM superfamily enzyme YgiQ (UPF0313 family)
MNHGILLGCMQTPPDLFHIDPDWLNIKRAAGAHKIASFMRNQGWDIEVLDYWLAFDFEEFKEFINSRVTRDTYFIGISGTFALSGIILDRANKYLRWVKEKYPNIAIIAGSKQLYVTRELEAHYHLTGYGEFGLDQLLKKLMGKESHVVINETMGLKEVNCDLHHPCYPQKDLLVKYEDRDFLMPQESMTLEFSRGCKFACKFCSYNVIGVRGDYTRDISSLYNELQENYDRFGITNYSVADETVNDSVEKLRLIAEQVKKLPFKPDMTGYIRVDLIAARPEDRVYLEEMGLWSHYYGIESLNHEAAKTIGKGMSPDKIKQGLLDVRDYFKQSDTGRYRNTFSMIAGLPHETTETFIDGLKWNAENMPEEALVIFPLYLSDSVAPGNKNNTSEFDRTWRESGKFHTQQGTDESFGATPDKLPEFSRDYFWNNYSMYGSLKWSHDTFNWWSANKIVAEQILSDNVVGRGIINWNLYNFVSSGTYTWDEALALSNLEYDVDLVRKDTDAHMEAYKWKKLSL